MKKQLERVIRAFEELVKSDPENQKHLSSLLEIVDNLEVCYQAGNLMDETVKLFDTKIDVYEKLFELEPGIRNFSAILIETSNITGFYSGIPDTLRRQKAITLEQQAFTEI